MNVPRTTTGSLGMTALGRLHLSVPEDGGLKDVVVERRWPDAAAARAWCERTVAHTAAGTSVLEIQVFEELWQHARSWETTPSGPVAESLQLGMPGEGGSIHWGESRSMSPHAVAPHAH